MKSCRNVNPEKNLNVSNTSIGCKIKNSLYKIKIKMFVPKIRQK